MKKLVIVLSVAVLGLSSCKQFKKGDGDMMYNIHTDKSGETIKEGDFVELQFTEKTEEDSTLSSSYDSGRPAQLQQQKSTFKGDLFTALTLLSEGDSATFKINIDSMVAKMGRPKPEKTKGKYLLYTIKVDKVIPKGKLTDSVFRSKVDAYFKTAMDKAKNSEAGKIKAYISSKDLKPTVTASGLNYIISKEGAGVKPGVGDTVEVNYTGMFLGGKVFDTSDSKAAVKAGIFNPQRPYTPIKVTLGAKGVFPGFEEALMLLSKGSKGTFIFPSNIAYGEQGSRDIPPYTPLVFELEVVNIIPKKAGTDAPTAATPAPEAPKTK